MELKSYSIFSLVIVLAVGLGEQWLVNGAKLKDQDTWWRNEVFYQIYPRSFKDSNGDGVGDLKGITSKLQYFADTGITSVWLSPIYQSPMVDFGYDISDYKAIQPEYGTLEDFDELIANATKLGIKIILDFVPNHSSDKHEWFIKSAAREEGYEDFYIWENGTTSEGDDGTHSPPNNWLSVFSGSAWEWNEQRQQYYLRQFTKGQPDLNYRNPAVVQAMDDILLFWLKRGVAGFRVDAVIYVYEDEQLRDEPVSGLTDDTNSPDYLDHIYTRNQPEGFLLIQHWRRLLDNYTAVNGGHQRIMMLEAYTDINRLMNYYEDEHGVQGAQFPFNFDFITELNRNSSAQDFVMTIERWLIYMPPGHVPNWVMGNHDNPRVGSRYDERAVDAMNMLLLTLPGIGVTYYGEELGMVDYRDISYNDTVDQPALDAGPENYKWISRDPERTPMQWSDDANAGFSTGNHTWLPVHPNYEELNLRAQQRATRSHYKIYQSLIKLRKQRVLQEGSYTAQALNRRVFAFKRELKGQYDMLTVINVSNRTQQVDVSDFIGLPNRLTLQVVSVNSQYRAGERVLPADVVLAPYEGLVAQLRSHL